MRVRKKGVIYETDDQIEVSDFTFEYGRYELSGVPCIKMMLRQEGLDDSKTVVDRGNQYIENREVNEV